MHKIIALSGFKGAGKSTVSDMISYTVRTRMYTKPFAYSFAEPIRQVVSCLYGVNEPEHSEKEKRIFAINGRKKTYRELLISVGEHIRKLDYNVFTKALENKILDNFKHYDDTITVVSDVRYKRELDMLKRFKNQGCNVEHWLILRKESIPEWVHMFGSELATNKMYQNIVKKDLKVDSSEYELLFCNCKFDRVIHNDTTHEELEEKVGNFLL